MRRPKGEERHISAVCDLRCLSLLKMYHLQAAAAAEQVDGSRQVRQECFELCSHVGFVWTTENVRKGYYYKVITREDNSLGRKVPDIKLIWNKGMSTVLANGLNSTFSSLFFFIPAVKRTQASPEHLITLNVCLGLCPKTEL